MGQIGLPPERTVRKQLDDYSQIRLALAALTRGLQVAWIELVRTTSRTNCRSS
jgi:hypothetical protein